MLSGRSEAVIDGPFDFAALRAREFARLDRHGLAYLDYAATALYGESQLRAHHALLAAGVLGNPHSESRPSHDASAAIERARRAVLAWFDVDGDSHDVCFTANASAAVKLVAESYRFGPGAPLVLSADNHNSVNGMREYARRAGAAIAVLPLDAELRLDDPLARLAALAGGSGRDANGAGCGGGGANGAGYGANGAGYGVGGGGHGPGSAGQGTDSAGRGAGGPISAGHGVGGGGHGVGSGGHGVGSARRGAGGPISAGHGVGGGGHGAGGGGHGAGSGGHGPGSAGQAASGAGLFALPAQSNFSGVCHPLALVAAARALGFDVLLDAAAFAPSHPLSLRDCPAEFAVVSFHKLFGYPTSVGALVARRDALARLRRPWFAGGTVAFASVGSDRHRLHAGHAGFEDGTADFLGIAALAPGFALLAEVGVARLAARVASLTAQLLDELAALRHPGGAPLVTIYGPRDVRDRGGTVALNLRDARGAAIPYTAVEARARDAGVAVRGGCFCNPGAAEAAFGLDAAALADCLDATGDAFSPGRLADCLGRAVGAVRLSLGLASNRRDLDRALAVLASFA